MSKIIDISHHQVPSKINYKTLCSQLDMAIVRVQYGSRLIDRHYKTHIIGLRRYKVPFGVYAWIRGISNSDMRKEARDFYNRSKDLNPSFYVLDAEEKSMSNMREGINNYVDELRKLTNKKIGVYIANHLYKSFNLDLSKFDFVWIPHYGTNNGKPNSKPNFPCDLHQYTDKGRLQGYSGPLDLNRFMNGRTLGFFTGVKSNTPGIFYIAKNSPHNTTANVKELQSNLAKLGFDLSKWGVDGRFGDSTENAVKNFQRVSGLKIDGSAGPDTINKINESLRR